MNKKEKLLPNQKDSSIIIILMLVVMTIASMIAQAFLKKGTNIYLYFGFAIPQVVYIFGVLIYFNARNIPFNLNIKENAPKNWKLYLLAILLGSGLFFFALPINNFVVKFFTSIGINSGVSVPIPSSLFDYILCCVILGIMPAIGEELLYRKALGDGIEKLGTLSAVIIMGLLFSLGHLNISQTIYQFFMGCIFAVIYLTTKDIIITMLAHATNNILVILLSFLTPEAIWSLPAVMILCGICGLFAWVLSLTLILRKRFVNHKKQEKINIYLIILILIMVILWVIVAITSF
ncbi:MAG: CPBP family intramembrane glutamic endopeptidase [Clostridia bacterium]